jgi:hypothetical protein
VAAGATLAVAVAVAVVVGAGVVVEPSTVTVPLIVSCAPQTKSYAPAALNTHVPDQGSPLGSGGIGAGPGVPPASVHEVGCADSNTTLWKLLPVGELNVTVSPVLIVTVPSPVAGFSNASRGR